MCYRDNKSIDKKGLIGMLECLRLCVGGQLDIQTMYRYPNGNRLCTFVGRPFLFYYEYNYRKCLTIIL